MATGPIIVTKAEDYYLVWDQTDVDTLRNDYRIIASPIGPVPPSNKAIMLSLPAALLPEQVNLGVEEGWLAVQHGSGVDENEIDRRHLSKARNAVFASLWRQGFYVTAAPKFGGDFLVYSADPSECHASHVITVTPGSLPLLPADIVSMGRAAHMVKKVAVVASTHGALSASPPLGLAAGKDEKKMCDNKRYSSTERGPPPGLIPALTADDATCSAGASAASAGSLGSCGHGTTTDQHSSSKKEPPARGYPPTTSSAGGAYGTSSSDSSKSVCARHNHHDVGEREEGGREERGGGGEPSTTSPSSSSSSTTAGGFVNTVTGTPDTLDGQKNGGTYSSGSTHQTRCIGFEFLPSNRVQAIMMGRMRTVKKKKRKRQ